MEGDVPASRKGRFEGQTPSRQEGQNDPAAETGAACVAGQGPTRARLQDRPLDAPTSGGRDPQPVRDLASYIPSMADSAARGVELSKTRAPGTGTRPRGCRALAPGGLAAHKKTRGDRGAASFWWMKPAVCSSRWSGERGGQRATRLSCTVGTGTTGFLLPGQSLWRRPGVGSAFTFTSSARTSERKARRSWLCESGGPSGEGCWWSGIGGTCTARRRGCWPLGSAVRSPSSGFRPIRRTSTLWKGSGITRSMLTWPTLCRTILSTCTNSWRHRCTISAPQRPCFGRSSIMPDLPYDMILYQCKGQ